MKKSAIAMFATVALQTYATAADFKHVHVRGKQVVITTMAGKIIVVKEKTPVRDVRMAPDGMAAAWLLRDVSMDEPAIERGAATLVVYSKGQRRTLPCGQLIREYWFHQQGQRIAYDCGGRHFAGNEVLFDTRTLKELARFHQAEVALDKRPSWSSSTGTVPEQ